MSDRLSGALHGALESLAQGKSIEQALAPHGELASDLRPLLEAATTAAALGQHEVPEAALLRSRKRTLARAAGLMETAPRPPLLRLVPRLALLATALVVALAAGVDGISTAAAQSIPGDILYPVKIVSEDLRLRLAAQPSERMSLEALYAQRRVDEVLRLLALGREVPLSFQASVDEIGPILWTVGGVPVRVSPETRVLGEILPGMTIEVDGLTQSDGTFLAHELHLKSFDTLGTVASIGPAEWVIGNSSIAVDDETWIEAGIVVGDLVLVRVRALDDGSRVAESILRFAPPTPTPFPPPPTARPVSSTPLPTTSAEATEEGENDEGDGNSGPGGGGDDEGEGEEHAGEDEVKDEFKGVVQSVGSYQWVVAGRVLQVTGATEIRGDPVVGDTVKVVAFLQTDGTWWAEKIEREG